MMSFFSFSFVCVYVFGFCPHMFKAEEEKGKEAPPPASKNKVAKVSDKKNKNQSSCEEPSKEKKTKLKRRDDVEPPNFIGINFLLSLKS